MSHATRFSIDSCSPIVPTPNMIRMQGMYDSGGALPVARPCCWALASGTRALWAPYWAVAGLAHLRRSYTDGGRSCPQIIGN
jgi:hypothetical protein